MMNGGPIFWESRLQHNVSLSTSETEFVAASQAGQEAIYLRETLTDFGFSQNKATLLYEDNLACVAMSENPVRRRQEGHQQTAVEAVCAKVVSSCPRRRKLLMHDDKELLTRSSVEWKEWAIPEIHPYLVRARTKCRCSARREQAARQEGVAARRSCVASSPHNQFWGSVIFRAI